MVGNGVLTLLILWVCFVFFSFLLSIFVKKKLFLYISLSCSLLSFFLPIFQFCFLLLPFCLFVSFSCLCASILSVFGFDVLLCLSNPFALSFFFSDFKFCFYQCLYVSKKTSKKHQFLSKAGLQQNVFNNLCFAKCEKLSFFGPFLGQILVDVCKKGISTQF